MNLDLRIPIGLFFVIVGSIMAIVGLTSNPAIYEKSLGINVNLYWGVAEVIFGSLMIAFGRAHHEVEAGTPATPAGKAPKPRLEVPPLVPKSKPPVAHG
jgi:hypothetical protein